MIRLTREEILALHEQLIERFPMASGMRERSRFSSSPNVSRARVYSPRSWSERVSANQAESG
jgi:hypothetical protein